MLKSLYIRDYAIIDELTVEFTGGLNIITGETGAGKSILLDALGLLIGQRASSDDVRQGSKRGVVEGIFSIEKNDAVASLLAEREYDRSDSGEMILRREISASGGSRAFVNDSPGPVSLLREIGERLIDLHGQHDHQTLLRTETHGRLLDRTGGLDDGLESYGEAFDRMIAFAEEIEELRAREDELRRTLEFHEFQLREIDEIAPEPDEFTNLEREIKIREHAESLYSQVGELYDLLYSDTDSVRDRLLRARSVLDRICDIDESFSDRREELAGALVVIEELARSLQSYSVEIDFSPSELDTMRERLQSLNGLRKKYGGTISSVLEHKELIEREIELARNYDAAIEDRTTRLDAMRRKLGRRAGTISRKRKEIARDVQEAVVAVLDELGISNGRFEVRFDRRPGTPESRATVVDGDRSFISTRTGIDEIEFYISTNLGEDPKPLARTASGGEISRIMLALKTILARNDRLPLLVFDEIDTGISGRIARRVGTALRNLADYHQIIAITHLPQIASVGHTHFRVEKMESEGRTSTSIRPLDDSEREQEVARLLSGAEVSDSSIETARELLTG